MSANLHLAHVRKWLLQSPPVEWAVQHVRELLLGALRQGAVPQHVAFVMDGNRRFARDHHIEVVEGHNLGFEALARILEVCYKIGVRTVTIYAFSIENFKRSKYEVDALMDMAKVKLSQLAQHGELLERYGAKLQFLGQREMIRPDVLAAIDKAIALTSGNGRATLNICAPYTSRDEMTSAMRKTVADFSQPLKPRLKRPFSETRITRTIRAQKQHTISEVQGKEGNMTQSTQNQHERPGEVVEMVDEHRHNSKSDELFHQFSTKVSSLILQEPAEQDEEKLAMLSKEAAEHVLDILRDSKQDEAAHMEEINALLDIDISPEDYTDLNTWAHQIEDHPLSTTDSDGDADDDEARHSILSNSSTLFGTPTKSTQSTPHNYPDPETITAATLNANTFTGADCPPLDLLIRTSGVERLSDFMLWQCHRDTTIVFLKCMWPEFDLWHFLPVLLEWQWRKGREGRLSGEDRAGELVKSA